MFRLWGTADGQLTDAETLLSITDELLRLRDFPTHAAGAARGEDARLCSRSRAPR